MQYIPETLQDLFNQHQRDFSPTPALHAEIFSYPTQDHTDYYNWTSRLCTLGGIRGDGIDKYGKRIDFGCGPHSLRCLRKAIEILQPKSLLEIGFNMGYSSTMFLHMSDMKVFAVDISDKDETIHGARVLKEMFGNRFEFMLCDSLQFIENLNVMVDFDTIFIDGGHLEHHVMNDIEVGLRLNVKKFIFDDWWPCWGPGVQTAISKKPSIKITHVMGNIAMGIVE